MSEALINLIATSIAAVVSAFKGLLVPIIFFSLLAMLMRRKKALGDLRRALPEIHLNVKLMLFDAMFIVPMIIILGTFLSELVRDDGLSLLSLDTWSELPGWLTILIAIAIADFVGYWRHRLEHTWVLWPAHAVHHSDTQMTWIAVQRFHPINRFTTFVIDNLALFLLGVPPFAIVANGLVRHYYGAFIHADLPWTYGPLGRIFVSPAMHRWHHATDPRAFDTNFATVFSLWDQMFGTCRVPGPCDVPTGVTDNMKQSLRGQLIYPFTKKAYPQIFGKSEAATEAPAPEQNDVSAGARRLEH